MKGRQPYPRAARYGPIEGKSGRTAEGAGNQAEEFLQLPRYLQNIEGAIRYLPGFLPAGVPGIIKTDRRMRNGYSAKMRQCRILAI
jgi:hypothetical protein